jgi:hypothetical protein
MKYRLILFLLFGIDALILCFETSHVSIASSEAVLLYDEHTFLSYIVNNFLSLVGKSDFTLRLPFIIFHLLSALLIYLISKEYVSKEKNRLWLLVAFMLLPGVVSSAIMVNHAGFLIFGLLFYIYVEKRVPLIWKNLLLFLYSLIDGGFSYLFLGVGIYNFHHKDKREALYSFGLYILNAYLYGFDVYGYPRGHFLDTIGLYSAIFTPVIFIYIFYTLYRRYLTAKKDELWYISVTALIFSLVLSFRQRVPIEHFAPYLIVAMPLAAQTFVSSYRVRLKEHRKGYRAIFILAFILLILNTLVVFFNKELYLILDNPKKNFAYNMHIAKELAQTLKNNNIKCLRTDNKMQRRLRFYGIEKCSKYILLELPLSGKKQADVTISYKGKILYRGNVTKLNNK